MPVSLMASRKVRREHLRLAPLQRRRIHGVGWVPDQQFPLHRVLERLVQHRIVVLHRPAR